MQKLPVLLCLVIFSCSEKGLMSVNYDEGVSALELKKHVLELSSDEYEGRGAGYPGEKKAAIYIAQQFESNGLLPVNLVTGNVDDYFTPFSFHTREPVEAWKMLTTQNVVGVFRGSRLPEEYIIVGAHHDGQGTVGQADFGRGIGGVVSDSLAAIGDTIWNSAIDNAVSISAIIEIIRILKEEKIQTDRSILFSTFSAEESGLDGSVHLANHLPVPKHKIKAMINLEQLVGDPDAEFLYVSYDSNPIFEQLQKEVDSLQAVTLTPFYAGVIADTDHFPFYMRRIPSVTLGTGSQVNVHTSLDHAEGLDYKLLEERTNYILSYVIRLANAESTFDFSGNVSEHLGVLGCQATKMELNSKRIAEDVAFKVTAVIKDSKGDASNILPGDLIIAVDGKPVNFPKFYRELIDVIGETKRNAVTLKIRRGDEVVESTLLLE